MSSLTLFLTFCVALLAACVGAAPTGSVDLRRSTTYSGQGTYFSPGLGACGETSSSKDLIVAVGHERFDDYPGATSNPNDNPICGKKITAHYGSKSVTVKVVDRCTGCGKDDLDFSPSAFSKLAAQSKGRIDITWEYS